MAKKTVTVKAEGSYTFTFDPESKEFKEALSDYRAVINKHGDEKDMLLTAAHQLRMGRDANTMLEGIGYLQKEGRSKPEDVFSGIIVENDDPDFEYEIE